MISTEQFLALLEEKELISPKTLASLRQQIAQSKTPIAADALAKRLVKHGRITTSQAKRLLGAEGAPPSKPAPSARPDERPAPAIDDDLGLAPLDGEEEAAAKKKSPKVRKPIERKPETESRPTAARPAAPAPPTVAPPVSLLDEEIAPLAESDAAPLDNFLSDAAMSAASFGSPLAAPAASSRVGLWQRLFGRRPKIQSEEEKWGSSLMLVGGGALVSLVILGGALFWALTRGSGDEMFRLADEDYRAGSYAQAIHKYNAYLEKFPTHAQASVARVRVGLAELRQASQSGSWASAVEASDDVLARIATETDFKEAHGELASILPEIASRLAIEARRKPDPATVQQVRHMLALTDKYVPKSLRPVSKIADVEASLGIVNRDIARGNELDKTISVMQASAKELKTADAYAACTALLHQYPDLATDARLKETLLAVSAAQQGLVKTVAEPRPAVAGEVETAVVRSTTLVQRESKSNAPSAEGRIALAAADGAVYGLDAASGRVLWRRFVGFDANPRAPSFPPTPLTSAPDADVLAVDASRNELVRLAGATGRVVWRFAVGEPFDAHPVVTGDKILVATRGGKLITVATASGESPGYVQFPQPLVVAPTVDVGRSLIYQVAASNNLFILSAADGACRHVVYLGHDTAGIAAAPTIVEGYLLLAVNGGVRDSILHVFALRSPSSAKDAPWLKPIQQIRLAGHVQTQPLVEGRRVLIATNSGVVRVFEISATNAKTPLNDVAETAVEGGGNLTRFALMRNGQFWIADNRLTKYDVQAARGRLAPKWIDDVDSAFLQPPVAIGRMVVSVRRKLGMPGAIVSAVAEEKPDKFWETRIASPLAGEPLVLDAADKNKGVVAVTANGGVFRVDPNQSESSVIVEPIAASDPFRIPQPINRVVRLADGWLAISGGCGGDQVGVFDPTAASPMMYWHKLPGKLACDPVAFGRGLLAPCLAGQVYWIDLTPRKIGESLAEPFQPRLEPGAELAWTMPAPIGDTQCVISDGNTSVYRLDVVDKPKPHLAALAQTIVKNPIAASLAVLGETAFAADNHGLLVALPLPELAGGREIALGGRCAWGPFRAGDAVLLATDDDQLQGFDAKGNRIWTAALAHGPLAGAPLGLGDSILLVSRSGILQRIEAATGKESAKADAGRPLATGPVTCGKKLLVGGYDGTLYEVRQP